jgi:hypothetical protein
MRTEHNRSPRLALGGYAAKSEAGEIGYWHMNLGLRIARWRLAILTPGYMLPLLRSSYAS